MILEICVDHACSARSAIAGGANRLEVCGPLSVGGTTPSAGLIEQCLELGADAGAVEISVMIRPHAGGFQYAADDIATMARDLRIVKALGATSVVFGVLTADRKVDFESVAQLVELARPMQVTFHRAFDVVADPFESLDKLIQMGVDRLLTSGQATTAEQGQELIAELVDRARGEIAIIAGSGIKAANVAQVIQRTGVKEIHASASEKVATGYPIDFGGEMIRASEQLVRGIRLAMDEDHRQA